VTGARRALGSLLMVDPAWRDGSDVMPAAKARAGVAVLPLTESALLVSALADNGLQLRQRLDNELHALEQS
jgi:urease accessory protein